MKLGISQIEMGVQCRSCGCREPRTLELHAVCVFAPTPRLQQNGISAAAQPMFFRDSELPVTKTKPGNSRQWEVMGDETVDCSKPQVAQHAKATPRSLAAWPTSVCCAIVELRCMCDVELQ